MLKGKKILLGVTGSIAAYKSALLVRLLMKEGAEVKVVMTESAKEFITPLTLSVLSKNAVMSSFANAGTGEWTNHVTLGLWADAIVIAPASANTMAKMANGICDSLLLAVYMSARCPVFVAPAMDVDMLKHKSTQENLKKIKSFGNTIIEPTNGELASGLYGEGRMEEPEKILKTIENFFEKNSSLSKKKVLVTAGPTYESIDAVRFIGNRSSGKMGFALAEEFANAGADVVLISGPSFLVLKNNSVERIDVNTADEMFDACMKHFSSADITVMAAAVADYKVAHPSKEKIKKENKELNISFSATKDILAEMGKRKKENQLLIGFALETNNEVENAKAKLKKKNLDMIILNSLNDKGAGFNSDTNKVLMIDKKLQSKIINLKAKQEVAKEIVTEIISKFEN